MISEQLRQLVRERARNRCEYCHLHQNQLPFVRFHIDHVIARKHGGQSDSDNLALACLHCNSHKGSNLAGIDQDSRVLIPLFDPRSQSWDEHFENDGAAIVGKTSIGRVTVDVLQMNGPDRLKLREEL